MFDPDKRYLYFLSDRDYNEVLGNIDFEFANPKTTRVYVVTLTADEPSPFPALSDEVKVKREEPPRPPLRRPSRRQEEQPSTAASKKEEKAAKRKAAETETKEPPKEFKIDLDGIQDRIVALAVPPAVIRRLRCFQRGDLLLDCAGPGAVGAAGWRESRDPCLRSERPQRQSARRRARSISRFPMTARSCCTGPMARAAQVGIIDAKAVRLAA